MPWRMARGGCKPMERAIRWLSKDCFAKRMGCQDTSELEVAGPRHVVPTRPVAPKFDTGKSDGELKRSRVSGEGSDTKRSRPSHERLA